MIAPGKGLGKVEEAVIPADRYRNMPDALSLYTLTLAFAAIVLMALAFVGLFRSHVPGALPFALLMAAGMLYAFGSIFEIRGATIDELHLWLSVEYLGVSFIGPLWLLLALETSGIRSRRISVLLACLFAEAFVLLAMVWTNDLHHLFYSSMALEKRGNLSVSLLGHGPLYWLNIVVLNACLVAADIVLLVRAVKAPGPYRKQAAMLFAASLFPWSGMLLFQAGVSPYGLDIAPFFLTASGLLFSWSLFRHRLIDLGPVAYEHIFEGMGEGVLVLDRKSRVVNINPAMSAILGIDGPACIGLGSRVLFAEREALAAFVAQQAPARADLALGRAPATRHYAASLSPIRGRRGRLAGSILSLNDITLRVGLTKRLEELATTDGLTGVTNRRTVLERAAAELGRAQRQGEAISFLILDLDQFKTVNDTHGHQAGDAVLSAAASACLASLRASDLLGRYGGEEFLVVLPGVGPAEAGAAAERLRAAVAGARIEFRGESIGVTTSIGCAGRERAGSETVDELVREADTALYRAKSLGRNRIEVFAPPPPRAQD